MEEITMKRLQYCLKCDLGFQTMEIGISVSLNDKSSEYFLVWTAQYRTTNITIENYNENFIIRWLDVLNT